MTNGRKWTEEDDADLLLMFGRGLTLAAIGEVLGRTRDAVSGRLAKLRHPPQDRIRQSVDRSGPRRKSKHDPVPDAVLSLAVCGAWRPAC